MKVNGAARRGRILAVSLDEAGRRLSVSGRTIRRLVDAGELRAVRVRGSWPVPIEAIDSLLAGTRQESA